MSDMREQAMSFGLTSEEYDRVLEILGREPNLTEAGVFSVMWSEHCSYKTSGIHLRKLPTTGPRVIQGPGENAGVVDIGDGLAVVFKMESHNHPSFIEPFQGAATGVGGILRDVFTMGARPVANLNNLRFGEPTHPRTPYLVNGVVHGIGSYGNCMGVPTVGGDVQFDASYNGNILVNAMTVGLVRSDRIFLGTAAGVGNPIFYVGSKTGRDGIHGATMASAEFSEDTEEKRPTVQVGDPFIEKLLLEACLELFETDLVVGIQDMGAAGLTSSSLEMAGRAGTGIEMHLDRVPMREEGMTPYELMLSESQERMLLVVRQGAEDEVKKIFSKWDLDCVEIGTVTDSGHARLFWHGDLAADLPIAPLADEAPRYDRPYERAAYIDEVRRLDLESLPLPDLEEAFRKVIASPNIASKEWIYDQYDHMVQTNTVQGPGGDAAVVRVRGTSKGIALSSGCNGRYCYLNPRRGAAIAVAETARNVSAVGALPLAVTDCLNFGNPERPDIMWQFVEAIEGLRDACEGLDVPVVSGNVSLYNETNGEGIYPTPMIGMVGLMDNIEHRAAQGFAQDGDVILLLGETLEEIGGSEYLQVVHGKVAGDAPELNLIREKALQAFCRETIASGVVRSAHDVSEGGIAAALAECCITGPELRGATLRLEGALRPDVHLFSESQSRIILSVPAIHARRVLDRAAAVGLPATRLGTVGGSRLVIEGMIDIPVTEINRLWRNGFQQAVSTEAHG